MKMYYLLIGIGIAIFFMPYFLLKIAPSNLDLAWWKLVGMSLFGAATIMVAPYQFAYHHELLCPEGGSLTGAIAIAAAFTPESEENEEPGLGNRDIANWLSQNSSQFSSILTQEAIIWALRDVAGFTSLHNQKDESVAGKLHGIPVYRIHRHQPGANIRTLETLSFAVGRITMNIDNHAHLPKVVLVAHDKQFERAYQDLRALYDGEIVRPCFRGVRYENQGVFTPLIWAGRELIFARPIDAIRRTCFRPHLKLAFPQCESLPTGSSNKEILH